ncbi:MAG TPA: hypothetical protein VIY48_17575 [Candidatus Paceibacterota bacterium]
MAYTNRTIRIEFPELGDDIWVAIHNPMLMPSSMLQPDTDIKLNSNNEPVDPRAAIEGAYEVAAKLVSSWNIYDPLDTSDNPEPFPVPATSELLKKAPQIVTMRISEFVGKALDPAKPNM